MILKIPNSYVRTGVIALTTFLATVAFATSYLQACKPTNDGPRGSCHKGDNDNACVITTNPKGGCAFPGFSCDAAANAVVTTTQIGTCVAIMEGSRCDLPTPPVAGVPGTGTANCK